MSKKTYILALMLCSILSYSQQLIFHENVNYRANTLHQNLNEEDASLLLESQTGQIIQVVIFNNDYSKNITVNNNTTKIDLKPLPYGDFVIQAKLDEKWIIMYLEKNRDLQIESSDQIAKAIAEKKPEPIQSSDIIVKEVDPHYYWVVSESNSSFGSNKSMRLEYKENVAKLISKTKILSKTSIGKRNTLFVYEIYNRSKFMTKQLRNPVYYKSEESELFNVVPVYCSADTDDIDEID